MSDERTATTLLSLALVAGCLATKAAAANPSPPVEHALRTAAAVHGVPYPELRAVSWCESRWNPRAIGTVARGLFQFLPTTFARTPYARRSILDPLANALATAWLVVQDGGWLEWDCQP